MVRKYEGMFLIRLKLRQQDLSTAQESSNPEAVIEQIKRVILGNEGEIIEEEIWAKRRKLAYEIDHENEAMYYRIVLRMDSSKVNKVRDVLRLNDRILRFIFFVLEEKNKIGGGDDNLQ